VKRLFQSVLLPAMGGGAEEITFPAMMIARQMVSGQYAQDVQFAQISYVPQHAGKYQNNEFS